MSYEYPFIPIQLTLTSMFTIGIPSFLLALEKNDQKVKKNFLGNIISKSIPTALTIVFNIILIMIVKTILPLSDAVASTLCVIMTGLTGFILIRRILYILLLIGFIIGIIGFKNLLSLATIKLNMLIIIIILFIFAILTFINLSDLVKKYIFKFIKEKNCDR